MSRTFRRRNYEATVRNAEGSKIAGYYTEWQAAEWVDVGTHLERGRYTLRAPTEQERAAKYWLVHGESSNANAWSPGSVYRQTRERELRSHNARELIKYVQREDYSPMCKERPINCWWDWS